MSNKLNNKELADLIALKAQISESEAEMFLKELFKLIAETISETEVVKIKDLGTFKLTRVQARESVDVNTGAKIEIPSHLKVSFLPAPALKDLVNKPFSHFETTLLNGDTSFSEVSESEEKENENDDEDTALDNTDISEPIESTEHLDISKLSESSKEINAVETSDSSKEIVSVEPIESTEHFDATNNIVSTEPVKSDNLIDVSESIAITESSENVDTTNNIASAESVNSDKVLETAETKKNIVLTDNSNKTSLKPKRKRTEVWIPILGAVVVIGALIFFYTQGSKKNTAINGELHEYPANQIALNSDSIVNNDASIVTSIDSTNIIPATPIPNTTETVTLEAGKTLRLIALDKFGSRDFWIYIYLVNKDKIKNPDVIPLGTVLVLPDTLQFDINSKDPASVSKAKKLGDVTMKNLSNS